MAPFGKKWSLWPQPPIGTVKTPLPRSKKRPQRPSRSRRTAHLPTLRGVRHPIHDRCATSPVGIGNACPRVILFNLAQYQGYIRLHGTPAIYSGYYVKHTRVPGYPGGYSRAGDIWRWIPSDPRDASGISPKSIVGDTGARSPHARRHRYQLRSLKYIYYTASSRHFNEPGKTSS